MSENMNDSWARVELWRWQYGELPKADDCRKIVISEAVRKMAEGIMDPKDRPNPFTVAIVMEYLSRLLRECELGELKK